MPLILSVAAGQSAISQLQELSWNLPPFYSIKPVPDRGNRNTYNFF